MDIPQLKLLAGHVRRLLKESNRSVSHNQSLDLIAALPGLRNWPEVMAFPDRVASCELSPSTASRLAFRVKRKYEVDFVPQQVLSALSLATPKTSTVVPQIWPSGPVPGVYVTTSPSAISALLDRYEDATDGALLYAEHAGSGASGAIDLGEYGLWSSGLDRVPSGTLLVLGPLELSQESWTDSAQRIQTACAQAGLYGHRVAVLINTPTPNDLFADVKLMAVSDESGETKDDPALMGVVTEEGELLPRRPFSAPCPLIKCNATTAKVDAIPEPARALLIDALAGRTCGILGFGSSVIQEHWAADLVDASLALTEHAGPAARIMPRIRGTPAKDWQVPDATKQLPFLPSIESAYDRGYRRMIINMHYSDGDMLAKLGGEVLFISGCYGFDVGSMFWWLAAAASKLTVEAKLFHRIIALLGVLEIAGKNGLQHVSDLFIATTNGMDQLTPLEEAERYVDENRSLRWEDRITDLVQSGNVCLADLKQASSRKDFAALYKEKAKKESSAKSLFK